MNRRRVAALLRELAEAIEQDDARPKRVRRVTDSPEIVTDPQVISRVRRGLRRAGLKT